MSRTNSDPLCCKDHVSDKVETLDDSVRVAVEHARPGNQILFSPACSSFDMFESYEERGLAFKEAARKYMGMAG